MRLRLRLRLRHGARPRYFVWTKMHATLKAGDKAAALEFLTPTAQDNYSQLLDSVILQMPAVTATQLPGLLQTSLTETTADYLVTRMIGNKQVVFGLRFVLMDDGKWRLEAM